MVSLKWGMGPGEAPPPPPLDVPSQVHCNAPAPLPWVWGRLCFPAGGHYARHVRPNVQWPCHNQTVMGLELKSESVQALAPTPSGWMQGRAGGRLPQWGLGGRLSPRTPGGGGGGRRYRVPGQPLLNRHQVGGVSRSPDGLFAQQEREPIRGRPAVRGKSTYGGRPGQRVEEQGTWASRTQKHSEAGYGRPVDRGAWTAKTVKRPRQQPAHPQYANYWAPLTRKRHTMPHSAQPQHANYWAPRTRNRHQQEHRPQRLTERSDPTQHAKGRTRDCPGPRKGATTRRNVTQGGGGAEKGVLVSGALIVAVFFLHKHWHLIFIEKGANDYFSDPQSTR